jgi:hypothetical protein
MCDEHSAGTNGEIELSCTLPPTQIYKVPTQNPNSHQNTNTNSSSNSRRPTASQSDHPAQPSYRLQQRLRGALLLMPHAPRLALLQLGLETKGREELDIPQQTARLKQWCEDATAAEQEEGGMGIRYDFLYVDEEGFQRYEPKFLAELVARFSEHKD